MKCEESLSKPEIFDSLGFKHEIRIYKQKGCSLALGAKACVEMDSTPGCPVPWCVGITTTNILVSTLGSLRICVYVPSDKIRNVLYIGFCGLLCLPDAVTQDSGFIH